MIEPTPPPEPPVVDPCERLEQLRAQATTPVDTDQLLLELRLHRNALERTWLPLDGADLRRQCVCELWCLLDRALTAGAPLPADWARSALPFAASG